MNKAVPDFDSPFVCAQEELPTLRVVTPSPPQLTTIPADYEVYQPIGE